MRSTPLAHPPKRDSAASRRILEGLALGLLQRTRAYRLFALPLRRRGRRERQGKGENGRVEAGVIEKRKGVDVSRRSDGVS